MEAPELLIAFRGTNFSRRTTSDPSRTHLEPYFAKSHPSVSIFSAKKSGADQDWVGFGDWAIGGWPIGYGPLGGHAAPSSLRKCAPRPHVVHFWISFGLFGFFGLLLDFSPFVALLLPYSCPSVAL